jgi:hypothetical protein
MHAHLGPRVPLRVNMDARSVRIGGAPRDAGARAASAPWLKHFFERHADDDPARRAPARDFLQSSANVPIQLASAVSIP